MNETKNNIRDIRPMLQLIEWSPKSLRATRKKLGLKQEEIANVMGVTKAVISNLELEYTTNVWAIQLYGIILERYYAALKGYIPAYRKEGTSEFMM